MTVDVTVVVASLLSNGRLKDCIHKLRYLPKNYEYIIASEKGKGKAIVDAVKKAKGNIIVTIDSDFNLHSVIDDYVERFKYYKADLLVGKRLSLDKPFSRRVSSKLYNFYKQVLFGSLPDTQSGFKIFYKDVLLQLEPFKIDGLAWDTEFVVKAKEADFKVVESTILDRYSKGTVTSSKGFKMGFDLAKLWLSNKYNVILFFVSLIYLVGLVAVFVFIDIPIGTDVYFHYDVANYYANFQNGMLSPTVLAENYFPYPPLFHLILVPSIWLGIQNLFAQFLQVALPFLIYLSTIIFIRFYTNPKVELTVALVLLSTMGFIDGTIQARPQGLTMLIIPVALFTFIQNRDNKFTFASGLITYTHGIAGLANIWTLMFYGFKKHGWNKTFVKLIIVLSPIIILTLLYLNGAISKWGGSHDTYQEYLIFTRPQEMVPYYSGMCLIGWVFLGYNIFRWNLVNELEKTLSLSLLGLTIMIPLWADRFLQYSSLSLACLAGLGLYRFKRTQYIVLPLVSLMYILVMVNLFWVTATNNWWLYPQ